MNDALQFSLPRLTITLEAYAKLMAFIRESYVPHREQRLLMEVSGFGNLVVTDEGNIEIVDAFVLPQVCSRGHTSLLEETLGDFWQMVAEDDDADPRSYAWWHSHCTGKARFSATDHSTIASMSASQYWVSLVGNVHGDLFGRIDVFRPERRKLVVPALLPDASPAAIEAAVSDVTDEVRTLVETHVRYVTREMGDREKLRHVAEIYGRERAEQILSRLEAYDD